MRIIAASFLPLYLTGLDIRTTSCGGLRDNAGRADVTPVTHHALVKRRGFPKASPATRILLVSPPRAASRLILSPPFMGSSLSSLAIVREYPNLESIKGTRGSRNSLAHLGQQRNQNQNHRSERGHVCRDLYTNLKHPKSLGSGPWPRALNPIYFHSRSGSRLMTRLIRWRSRSAIHRLAGSNHVLCTQASYRRTD